VDEASIGITRQREIVRDWTSVERHCHDASMLSKAERRRLQVRTRNAILAHGAAGRWLGGRPNYGYWLVDTDSPHPRRQKATAGIRLRVLEPDPETASVVRRIFELFDQGIGCPSIES